MIRFILKSGAVLQSDINPVAARVIADILMSKSDDLDNAQERRDLMEELEAAKAPCCGFYRDWCSIGDLWIVTAELAAIEVIDP